MSGVIVGIFTAISLLVYSAYSGEQARQCTEAAKNSTGVQELKINVRVMQTEFSHVRDKLEDLKEAQETQFGEVIRKLDKLNEKGGTRP